MGRGDNRQSLKMRQKKAQQKKLERIARKIEQGKKA
jgi:hypothetical protein